MGRLEQVHRGSWATHSSRLPSFPPSAGHGRAGGRVPAGGEVSRPQNPVTPQGPDPQVAFQSLVHPFAVFASSTLSPGAHLRLLTVYQNPWELLNTAGAWAPLHSTRSTDVSIALKI